MMQQMSPLSTPGSDIPSLHSPDNTPLTPQEVANSQLLGTMGVVEDSGPQPIPGVSGVVDGSRRWPPLEAGYLNWIAHDGRLSAWLAHDVTNMNPGSMFASPNASYNPASMPGSMDGLLVGAEMFSDLHDHPVHPPSEEIDRGRHPAIHHRLSLDTGSVDMNPRSLSIGQYYVDGDDCGRLPRIKKRKYVDRIQSNDDLKDVSLLSRSESGNILGFCAPETYSQSTIASRAGLPMEQYTDIVTAFKELCCRPSFVYPAFDSSYFLPYEVVDSAIALYFEEFNTVTPLVHAPTFKVTNAHWLLILALASVGMHPMHLENRDRSLVAMHEFTRRAVFASVC